MHERVTSPPSANVTPIRLGHPGGQFTASPILHHAPEENVAAGAAPPIVADTLRAPRFTLDSSTRPSMEDVLGHDFGVVRVHAAIQRAVGDPTEQVAGERPDNGSGTATLDGEQGGGAETSGLGEQEGEGLQGKGGSATKLACQTLSLSDFKGLLPSGATRAADTEYDYTPKTPKPGDTVTAVFAGSSSWMQPRFATPTDRKATSLDKAVSDCEDFLNKNAGAFWDGPGPTGPPCAAAAAFPNTKNITKVADCEPKIGAAIEAWLVGDSARVLNHEQFHLNLACTLADKATKALAAGKDQAKVASSLMSQDKAARGKYDTDTDHGCKAAEQKTWEANITGGLTSYPIP